MVVWDRYWKFLSALLGLLAVCVQTECRPFWIRLTASPSHEILPRLKTPLLAAAESTTATAAIVFQLIRLEKLAVKEMSMQVGKVETKEAVLT